MTVWRMPHRFNDKGKIVPWTMPQTSERLLAEVCSEIKSLLRGATATDKPWPSIAVLVNTNRQAEAAARALAQWNVPFDHLSSVSVYASDEALELETVLAAITATGRRSGGACWSGNRPAR